MISITSFIFSVTLGSFCGIILGIGVLTIYIELFKRKD